MPHTLLLADDSVTIQRVIELTFADEDITVVAVSDGDQAIERVEAEPPDIVLADIGMPGRNGYEVARHIKRSPRLSHIPVLLLTGAFEPVDRARAAEAGCDGVLAKPFEPQLVIGRVKELLANVPHRAAGAGGAPADRTHPSRPAPSPQAPVPHDPTHAHEPPRSTGAARPQDTVPTGSERSTSTSPKPTEHDLDAYFDNLDAAFDKLSKAPTAMPAPNAARSDTGDLDWLVIPGEDGPAPPQSGRPAAGARADTGDLDWLVIPGEDGPAPYGGPSTARERAAPPATPVASSAPAAAAKESGGPRPLPSIADAFAALLAAEEADPNAANAATNAAWPASAFTTDELVERVARLVLQRIADRISPEQVAAIVSDTAERLIREEIERIKASIK